MLQRVLEESQSAIERGDISELQRVLEETELDIGSEPLDSEGQTALHIACANGHLHIAQYLVNEKECSVMVEDVYGHDPFVLSLINKHWKVADFLLAVAPSSDSFKKHIGLLHYGESLVAKVANEAFTESCSSGYFQLVMFLKEKHDTQISETCIQSALSNGHINIALYLKFGEDDVTSDIASLLNKTWVNKKWKSASDILQFIKKSGSHEIIGLSSIGLDQLIDVVPFTSHAFNIACCKGYLDVVRYLYEKGLSSPALESARSNGHLHIVHFLLINCKCTKPDDMSEIHFACIVGDGKKVSSSLASNGVTLLSTTDQFGMNALHYASCEPKILRMIIALITGECIALFNTKDQILGNTPLHYAVLAGCTESVGLLLSAPECDINLVNTKRETPLHLACRQSDMMILDLLISEEMCNMGVKNINGETALHIAVMVKVPNNYIKELILHKSCNPSIINHDGMTSLQLAINTDHLSAVEVLLHCGKCSHEDIAKAMQGSPCLLHRVIHADMMSLFMMITKINECNINEVNHDGLTPLHIACTVENMEYIPVLTQNPTCDMNIQDDNGDTALHTAACSQWNSIGKIQYILQSKRCDPTITNKEGYAPLYIAIIENRPDSVKILLNSTKCNPNIQDTQGNTALHFSLHQKSATVIEPFLMCDKVDVNIQNKKGNTPLHVAVITGTMLYIIENLIRHPNCNPSITNHEGITPLQLAFKTVQLSAIEVFLLSANFSHEDIAKAMQYSPCLLHRVIHVDIKLLFEMLIEFNECIINEVNPNGQTPLHIACTVENMEYIPVLTQNPTCDLNIQDDNGDTALHIAACNMFKSTKNIQYMLECDRCDPNITNKEGYTPLHVATLNIKFESMKMLLNSTKCKPNIQDHLGNTALHLSIHQMSATVIEHFLMCDKVDVNIQNGCGNTPLHVAVVREPSGRILGKIITHRYCNPSITNHKGMTPLQLASNTNHLFAAEVLLCCEECSHEDITKAFQGLIHCALYADRMSLFMILLEIKECDINEVSLDGQTPLHVACTLNNLEYIKILTQQHTCDLNIQDYDGDTALHITACNMFESTEKVQYILECDGCDPNITNKDGYTPLHVATVNIKLDIVKMLLNSTRCNPNIQDLQGNTALHLSIAGAKESVECSLVLIQQPTCDLNIQDDNGDTALHIAACSECNSAEMIKCILECDQCDPNIINKDGYTPLHVATVNIKLDTVTMLLNSTKCKPNIQDLQGNTALHLSICLSIDQMSDTITESFLMCDNVNVNFQNKKGNTPLHVALITDTALDIIEKLIGHPNCNPSITNHEGMTPLQLAFKANQLSAMEVLLLSAKFSHEDIAKAMHGSTCLLHRVIHADMMSLLTMLIEFNECIINEVSSNGQTPLHVACTIENMEYIQVLTKNPTCDLNIQDNNGDTALHIAACNKLDSTKKIQHVLQCDGCDPNITNKQGYTPLHVATVNVNLDTVKMLLNSTRCNPNIQDLQGNTALHLSIAGAKESVECSLVLIQQPTCDLNIQDDNGDTALHIAACSECNSAEKIQCILDSGRCDPNITNKKEHTPLHISITKGQFESTEMLLECPKCSPNTQDASGNTALHLFIDRMFISKTKSILKTLKKLIRHPHCTPSIANHEGMTPLQLALQTDQLSSAELFSLIEILLLSEKCSHEDIAKAIQCSPCLLHRTISANMSVLFLRIVEIKECDKNEINHDHQTALHVACAKNNIKYIQVLTQLPTCDLNIQDDNGDTALHIAACSGWNSAEKIQCILDSGRCNPNITNKRGLAPLHTVSQKNQFDIVKILLNSTKCDPNIQDVQGNTALHLSIHQKLASDIEPFLMCDKVDVNIQNRHGDTPLHVALIQGASPHVIRTLTHHEKCNVCIVNNKGMTPLHISLNTREIAIAKIIATKYSRKDREKMEIEVTSDVLHKVVFENCTALVQALHFQSEKVHLNLGFNETALHVACKEGYCDIIEILLDKGADVQAVNDSKCTPIHIVCRDLRLDCLKVLLGNKKCDLNQQNANGDTALHIVCKMVNTDAIYLDMIQILLENGADVQAVDSNGDAPIHIVCKGLRLDCLKALLQSKGRDPNQQNADGDTALHIVCKMVNIDTVHFCKIEILLEKGANVQVVNKIGDAPIHIACNGLRLHCLKALLQSQGCDPNQQNVDGDTALHIVCRMGENLDSNMRFIEALISTPGIDPEIANHAGLTPIEVAGTKYFVIQTVTNFLKHKQSSIQTYLKIFVVGNSGTGKSTLIKAVTTEASQLRKYAIFPKMKLVNPSDVPPYTAGIVPISLNSKHFGHAVLYDFAGQHEYYSSHAAVMENLILPSPPLFLLLIDISKPIEEIKEELIYWWQFINNHSQRAAVPPRVMFVGSHKDIVRARGEDPQSIIDEIIENSVRDIQVSFTFEGSFLLDCRKLVSQGLTALLTKLNTTCQVFRKNAGVNLHCHILKAFLTTTELKELVYCQIFKILEKINSDDAFLPQSSFQLIPLLSTLSDQGHILLLQNHTDLNKSWVILKPEVLLAKVNGSIFAPDYFKEHLHNFAMSTGVVTFTKIREKFTEFNHEVIIEFLIHLEFCFRIKDEHTLKMITEKQVSLTNLASEYREEYYFFPALVRNENPENVFQPLETDMYQCGWFYKCGRDTEQLTTRFLHVLILRLAFSCEPPYDPTERETVLLLRSCSVWKHGIAWWTNERIETIVEVGLQCRWVAVMMRCPDTHKVQCAELRSKVIRIVLKAKQEFCQATKMNEFLIAPSCLQYPFEVRKLTLYSIKTIASVVVEGKDYAKDFEETEPPLGISQLLPFEPYYNLEDLIDRFFTAEQSLNEEISQECLEEIAMKCHKNLRDFETALQPNLIAYEEECSRVGGSEVMKCVALFRTLKHCQKRAMKTWRDFEHVFRRFSIFCGRNPMVILFV